MAAAKDTATAPVIDITKHGYFKLLGKGQLPQQPVVVRAKFVSKLAEKKIKEVGAGADLALTWRAQRVPPPACCSRPAGAAAPGGTHDGAWWVAARQREVQTCGHRWWRLAAAGLLPKNSWEGNKS